MATEMTTTATETATTTPAYTILTVPSTARVWYTYTYMGKDGRQHQSTVVHPDRAYVVRLAKRTAADMVAA